MKKCITVFLLFFFSLGVFSNQDSKFYHFLYNYEMTKAKHCVAEHLLETKDTLSNNFMKVNYLWWYNLSRETQERSYNQFDSLIEISLNQLEQIEHKTIDESCLEVSLVAFQLRKDALEGNYFSSLSLMFKYRNKIDFLLQEANRGEVPLIKGLYNTCFGHLKENNFFARHLLMFLPDGNQSDGLSQLGMAARSDNFRASVESCYFSYKIYNELYKQKNKARQYLSKLLNQFPNNIIFKIEFLKHFKGDDDVYLSKLKQEIKDSNYNENQKKYLTSIL